jgi:phage-related protein
MATRKPVEFRGSSLDDLRAFPGSARRESGHQIDRVQQGFDLAAERYRELIKELGK